MTTTTIAYAQANPKEPLRETTIPIAPGPADIVVEVAGCGVCHTDLGFLDGSVAPRGPRPLVPGHEVSGVVVEAGPEHAELRGRQVVVPAVWPCGECELCRHGRPNSCQAQRMPGNDVAGGFAHRIVVPAWCVAPLPHEVSRERLQEMAVIADAIATPYEAVVRAGLAEGDLAVVVGAGGLGGFLVQLARAHKARVLALDISDDRLALAAAHGASATLNVKGRTEREVREWVKGAAREAGARRWGAKIFETSGTTAGQRIAYELLGPAATLVVVGFTRDKLEVRLSNLMAFDATAMGIWGCRPELYPRAIEHVLAGDVVLEPFVERFPMSRVNEVVEASHAGKLRRRAVLVPDGKTSA